MKVYKLRSFARFARKERLDDAALIEAVHRAAAGLVDGDLGGGLIKQRIARRNAGRRGGFRTILAITYGTRAVFLHGFAKKDLENIDDRELAILRENARIFLSLDNEKIELAKQDGLLIEVPHD